VHAGGVVFGRALVLPVSRSRPVGMHPAKLRSQQGRHYQFPVGVTHLWQGFSIAAIIVGGFTLVLIVFAVFRYGRKEREYSQAVPVPPAPGVALHRGANPHCLWALLAATLVVENKENQQSQRRTSPLTCWRSSGAGSSRTLVLMPLVYGQTTQTARDGDAVNTNVHINLRSST